MFIHTLTTKSSPHTTVFKRYAMHIIMFHPNSLICVIIVVQVGANVWCRALILVMVNVWLYGYISVFPVTFLLMYLWLRHHTAPCRNILLHTLVFGFSIRWQRLLTAAFLREYTGKEVTVICNVFMSAWSELLFRASGEHGRGMGRCCSSELNTLVREASLYPNPQVITVL